MSEERKPVRERILETASEMFYRDGIRAVGIDAIIARSGVAKMSLYRNFPSKDALVAAWLEDRNDFFWRRWEQAEASRGDEPRSRMEGILDMIAATVSQACQLASVTFVALGALGAVTWAVWRWRDFGDLGLKKAIWRRFAANVVLALEFALGAAGGGCLVADATAR